MKSKILLTTDRVGYGHIRGMLAVEDAFREEGVKVDSEFASKRSSSLFRFLWNRVDKSLAFASKTFPDKFTKASYGQGLHGMRYLNELLSFVDFGTFEQYLHKNQYKIIITSHVTHPYLIRNSQFKVFLLGLDPYPPLYFCPNPNLTTTAVDEETAVKLTQHGAKNVLRKGPMVPKTVRDAIQKFNSRKEEIKSGKPMILSIATGGSLTHGDEITDLVGNLTQNTDETQVERIFVTVGDSKSMRKSVLESAQGDERVEIIYDEDPVNLVKRTDDAFGKADLIISKTGEIPFCVSGGKAFKTFHRNPSLGPQEIAIRDYVIKQSQSNGEISALELGINPKDEVDRILQQMRDGTLIQMMEAGLNVPADGAVKLVRRIMKEVE